MAKETTYANGRVDIARHDPAFITYKIGIYGWRKRCLYFLILLVLIMAIINLALTIWIIRVQDFGFSGMGKLHITKDGVRLDGTAEFMEALKAKTIKSRTSQPIQINSKKNISLSAVDENNKVRGQISLNSRQVILKNDELHVQNQQGDTLLYADDKKLKINIDNIDINVPGGLNLQSSIQTSCLKSDANHDLKIDSPTRRLFMSAPEGINIKSFGGDINLESLQETKIVAKKGKIVLDARGIQLKDIRMSKVPFANNTRTSNVYDGIMEVCMCKDGTLFLAPPDSVLPCKVTSNICP